jgi:hypothetical protein
LYARNNLFLMKWCIKMPLKISFLPRTAQIYFCALFVISEAGLCFAITAAS